MAESRAEDGNRHLPIAEAAADFLDLVARLGPKGKALALMLGEENALGPPVSAADQEVLHIAQLALDGATRALKLSAEAAEHLSLGLTGYIRRGLN